ncbi:MAG TPA: ATP synthase F1 subunit epsilon [Candidatus Eisenbacteria bacterium]|nr:ATP synthase F1 subunit epsilon [Candidatus Eisenbacteria bacterium]
MSDRGFRLTVLTGERAVLDGNVQSLIAPGSEGYLGVLRNHAPLVTGLMPGKLTVTDLSGKVDEYAISGGFLEVRRNVATVLTDAIEKADSIDVARAEKAVERAKELKAHATSELDGAEAESALRRAENRLRIGRAARRGQAARV